MNPRLKSSKKWTAFPKEYSEQIQTVFTENFAEHFDDAELIVEGRIYQQEILLRVGFHQKGRLAQANFEVSMDYSQDKQDAVARIHNCIDAAASMMMEYFENDGDVDFPYTWKEFPFQGQKLYLQYSTENSNLEAEANRLLGLEEGAMILEDAEDEDALSRAEQDEELSPPRDDEDEDFGDDYEEDDEDDEDEDKGPRMFSGKGKKKGDLH
ncbi:hypothetical protein [Bdellovibrio sp. HCB2-146]|uniref:hypothetical protein n=1 Tax=Bdellovibrio sp. HCB2-146 TaxID=3394362 RepID=UPI0039BD914F